MSDLYKIQVTMHLPSETAVVGWFLGHLQGSLWDADSDIIEQAHEAFNAAETEGVSCEGFPLFYEASPMGDDQPKLEHGRVPTIWPAIFEADLDSDSETAKFGFSAISEITAEDIFDCEWGEPTLLKSEFTEAHAVSFLARKSLDYLPDVVTWDYLVESQSEACEMLPAGQQNEDSWNRFCETDGDDDDDAWEILCDVQRTLADFALRQAVNDVVCAPHHWRKYDAQLVPDEGYEFTPLDHSITPEEHYEMWGEIENRAYEALVGIWQPDFAGSAEKEAAAA